jgi:aminoglycoside phosphotransferase (APT) family kinase protein
MSDDYRRHLDALHARLETPDEIVLAALAEVSRARVEQRRRIAEGEANEVHAFRLVDGLEMIMRIAHKGARGFEAERWAIEACRREGVPVPQILLIKRAETGTGPVDICIQRKIEGELLSNCLDLPRETLRALTAEAGDILSRVHHARTEGLGYLNGAGEGPFANFDELMADFLGEEAAYVALAEGQNFDAELVRRAFAAITVAIREAAPIRVSLTHNDFFPKHLLVKHGRIAGLIDFGEVSGEASANEFAKWDYLVGDQLPVAWLREGYADKSLFDEGYDRLFPALKLVAGLCLFAWYAGEGYPAGVAEAKRRLIQDLARAS